MVTSTMQKAVEALSPKERMELLDYISSTMPTDFELTEDEKTMIRLRDAEMDADPSIGLDWKEVYDELMAEIQ